MISLNDPLLVAWFWRQVRRGAPDECWLWGGTTTPDGYGRVHHGKRREYAHRIAYRLTRGDILPGLCVCHTCDVRNCANPAHLWLGTAADNNRDRMHKGRSARGPRPSYAKLDPDQVRKIRSLTGLTQRRIGLEYGLSPRMVRIIQRGQIGSVPMWETQDDRLQAAGFDLQGTTRAAGDAPFDPSPPEPSQARYVPPRPRTADQDELRRRIIAELSERPGSSAIELSDRLRAHWAEVVDELYSAMADGSVMGGSPDYQGVWYAGSPGVTVAPFATQFAAEATAICG